MHYIYRECHNVLKNDDFFSPGEIDMRNFFSTFFNHFIPVLIIAGCGLAMTGCCLPTAPTWTIMVYLDADNNLEQYGIEDLNEMEGVDLKRTGINVIVLFDRISGYDSSNGNWSDTRLYKVKYDSNGPSNSTIISEQLSSTELGLTTSGTEELNMGDPDVCSAFVDFCMEEYPGEDYFLIFWNHGSGWMKKTGGDTAIRNGGPNGAVCFDDTDGDALYTAEVSDSIEGKGVTVVGFDACYEGMLEVAYEIRNDASYMIASEETEGADGWEYNFWLEDLALSGQSATDLITAVVDAYALRYSSMTGATLSGIDLSRVGAVNTAMNNLCNALSTDITDAGIQVDVRDTLYNSVEDFYPPYTSGDLNLDLWHMAEVIRTTYNYADSEAAALKAAVEDAVVDEWHHTGTGSYGNPDAHGIAIHYCRFLSGSFNGHANEYMDGYAWGHILEFVGDSDWVPHYTATGPTGPGLLYRLWYEVF